MQFIRVEWRYSLLEWSEDTVYQSEDTVYQSEDTVYQSEDTVYQSVVERVVCGGQPLPASGGCHRLPGLSRSTRLEKAENSYLVQFGPDMDILVCPSDAIMNEGLTDIFQ